MELTVGYLKKVLEKLDDDAILAHLDYSNKDFKPQFCIKRLLVVKDESEHKGWGGHTFLVINGMGSHFTGEGEQKGLKFTGVYFDDETFTTDK
jgi:hypothetical protein